jgi:hypothetical protein
VTHRVITNPALTVVKVAVGHKVQVSGFEQASVVKEESKEIPEEQEDSEMKPTARVIRFVIAISVKNLTDSSLNNVTLSQQDDDQIIPVKDQKLVFLGKGLPKTQRAVPGKLEVLKARKRLQKRMQDLADDNAFEDEL